MWYVGMDVHRRRTQIAVVDEVGRELLNENVPNDPGRIAEVLSGVEPGTSVVFEATLGWSWLAELLELLGLEPRLAHPAGCKAIASARLKNDKVDARTLAQLLRADLLPEAWLAPKEVRDLRALLRHRAALVGMRTTMKCRIRAVLADHGAQAPSSLWTGPGRRWLRDLELGKVPRSIVDDDLGLLDAIELPLARLEREIATRAKPDARVEALQRLPGIGRLTAMTLVAEIGDRPLPHRPQALRVGRSHPLRPQFRPPGPPRSHHQAGLGPRALCARRGRPGRQVPTTLRPLLRPNRAAARSCDRHRGHRPQALGPQLPRPQGGERDRGQPFWSRFPCWARSTILLRLFVTAVFPE